MKHGSFKAFCLIVCGCMAVLSGYSDENTVSLESRILETFNGDSDYVWKTDASKFTTRTDDDSFPRLAYVAAWPIAVFGHNRDGDPIRSLGIHGRFDRRGFNWIDIYPTKPGEGSEDEPIEIPIPGRVRTIDMWVWGANLNFYVEAYLRDHQGVVHCVRMGDIAHQGWRNIRANIPNHIRQSRRILPRYAGLTFVKFRIWTQPTEKVGDFYVYFKQFKALTDMFESYFDGDDLANPDRVQELWADANN
jgi:hypothetical protein